MTRKLIALRLRALWSSLIRRGNKKASRGRLVAIGILIAFLIFYLAAACAILLQTYAVSLVPHVPAIYLGIVSLILFGAVFFFSVFETKSELFEAKDNDLLFSMPIEPRAVAVSRVSGILLINYGIALLVMLPAVIFYLLYGGAPAGAFGLLLALLLLPLAATALASFFGYLLAVFSARAKNKTLFSVVFSIALMYGYFAAIGSLSEGSDSLFLLAQADPAAALASMPFFASVGNALLFTELPILALIVGASLLAVVGFVLLMSRFYLRAVTAQRGGKAVYRQKREKAGSAFRAIVKKEFSLVFSNATILLNSLSGFIFNVLLLVAAIRFGGTLEEAFSQLGLPVSYSDFCATGIALVLILIAGMNNLSASAVSLEGKSLWIVRSLPIPAKTILLAKATPQFVITTVGTLLSGVVLSVVFRLSVGGVVAVLILPLLAELFYTLTYTVLNTALPRFDWANAAQVVKQSLAVFLTVVIPMTLLILLAVFTLFCLMNGFALLCWLVIALFFAAMSAIMYLLLATVSARAFDRL